jgi:drug/metabolite transporter (DMT)-like permease
MLIGGSLLYGYYIATNRKKLTIDPRDWGLFLQVIIFHIYIIYVLDLWALQYMTSITSAFIYNLTPFISALFSYFWFNEKITGKKALGLALGAISLIPIFYQCSCSAGALSSYGYFPYIAMLLAASSGAYGWILLRELIKNRHYSPIMVNGLGMLGGGAAALFTSWGFEHWDTVAPVSNLWPFLQLTLLIVITGNIFFYNLYGYLLKRYTATFLAFAGFTCPLFAALFGWLFLGESMSLDLAYSGILVFIGLYLFYQDEL